MINLAANVHFKAKRIQIMMTRDERYPGHENRHPTKEKNVFVFTYLLSHLVFIGERCY